MQEHPGCKSNLASPKNISFFSCLNKCRVVVYWGLLLSKSIIHSQNVLISKVDVHLSHISQLAKFHCQIISIDEVIADFFGTIFGTKNLGSILKGFWCPDEAKKLNKWVLARICTCRAEVAIFEMGL